MEIEKEVTFRPITPEELINKYNDHLFWYVFDNNQKQIVASPNMNGMEDLGYVFVEQADAESFRYILTKTPAYQDNHDFSVISDRWTTIDKSCAETKGEYKWIALEPDQAKIVIDYTRKDIPLSETEEQELRDLTNLDTYN